MIDQQTLPVLQDAVSALHARLTAGRARATGSAVKTGLTGRVTNLTPAELAILEDVMGGRWSATMSEIWARDALDAAGVNEEDWALEKEIAYWAIRRGYSGDELALIVERLMRAGPYRSKHDEPRGAVSWLAQDVANAIKTTQDRLSKTDASGPTVEDDGEITPETAPAEETPAQTIAALRRELRQARGELKQARATIAVQMTVINGERAEKEALREKLAEIHALLAVPSKRLSASAKCLAIVLDNTVERTTAYRADPENTAFVQVRYADLAAKTGGSDSTVTRDMKTLCTSVEHPGVNDTAPIWKSTRFVQREIDGELRPTSETVIAPKADGSILAAAIAYQPEEDRQHGGKRVKVCPEHPAADIIIRSTTHCAECDRQLGAPTETLRRQVDSLGGAPHSAVFVGLSGRQVDSLGGHDGEEQAERAANVTPMRPRTVNHHAHIEVSEEVERRDLDVTGRCPACKQDTVKRRRSGVWTCARCSAVLMVESWAEKPPERAQDPSQTRWRCSRRFEDGRVCGSLERYPRAGGGYRCDGCGDVVLPAVSGGSE